MKPSTVFCIDCGAANPAQANFCFSCGLEFDDPEKTAGLSEQIEPGELLRKRYKILARIGQGGFGAVYKAEDAELGQRLVAVKEMGKQGLTQREKEEGIEAFKREALMLAGLRHEHLPRIYEHFEEEGSWYLVMDYIEGETLEERFSKSRDGSLPLVMALSIALQLCDVLDYLHTRQPPIIFRDLKPANVILTPGGDLFLIDFGIARHFKPGQAKDTIAFGSPGYAAPEQYGKAQTTPRADLYSLGAILHQMLTGNDPSLSPFRFAPLQGYDPALQQLLRSLLEMDEARRPDSAATVRQTLRYLRNHPPAATSVPPRAGQLVPAVPVTSHFPALPTLLPALSMRPSPLPALVYKHHYGVVRAVAWSPDSVYAASATDAIVRVWHARSGQNLSSYREHRGEIKHMAWSPVDERIASISAENKVRIWESSTGKTISVYPGDPDRHWGENMAQILAWSSDGRYLAVAGNKYIYIWDTVEHRTTMRLRGGIFYGSRALCWSPDGNHLAAAYGRVLLIHHLMSRPKISRYHYDAAIMAAAWSPDGTYLASGGYDRVIHVWNMQNDGLVGIYWSHGWPITALAWAPDSRRIVSASLAAGINVWDALNGWGILSYHAQSGGQVLALAWSPDGRSILSGGSDCKICVWHAP